MGEVKRRTKTPLVLVVDDYEDTRTIYSEYLRFAGFRVIAYDRRGFGRTVTTNGPASNAPDDLEALIAHLGLDRVHLVGTAAGGIVATDYALSFPARIRSVVIANSIVGVQDEEYLEMGRRLRPKIFNDLPADFRELGPAYRAANPAGTERWLALGPLASPAKAATLDR